MRTGLLGLCVPWEARALSVCFLLRSALGPDGTYGSFWLAEPGAGAGLPGAWGVLWRGERGSASLAALSGPPSPKEPPLTDAPHVDA